jgi:phage terminase large subunit
MSIRVTPMSERKIVQIGYRPRNQFKVFHKRKQRWSVLVCHRRAGKTVATLNDLIRGAVNEGKHEGRYAFIFPQRSQAKDTAWRYLRRYAEPLLAKPPNRLTLVCAGDHRGAAERLKQQVLRS